MTSNDLVMIGLKISALALAACVLGFVPMGVESWWRNVPPSQTRSIRFCIGCLFVFALGITWALLAMVLGEAT